MCRPGVECVPGAGTVAAASRRRRESSDGASHPHQGANSPRRPVGRLGLFRGPASQRLHPAGAERRCAGDGEDGSLGPVRRRQPVCGVPLLGLTPRAHRGQRHAPRQLEPAAAGQLRCRPRYLSRPPQRLPVLRVAGRRVQRHRDQRRAHAQHGLEHGRRREGGPIRRWLDCRIRDPVQIVALPSGARAGVGDQLPPHGAFQERALVFCPGRRRVGRTSHCPFVSRPHWSVSRRRRQR